jgi:hypothetical protein
LATSGKLLLSETAGHSQFSHAASHKIESTRDLLRFRSLTLHGGVHVIAP